MYIYTRTHITHARTDKHNTPPSHLLDLRAGAVVAEGNGDAANGATFSNHVRVGKRVDDQVTERPTGLRWGEMRGGRRGTREGKRKVTESRRGVHLGLEHTRS